MSEPLLFHYLCQRPCLICAVTINRRILVFFLSSFGILVDISEKVCLFCGNFIFDSCYQDQRLLSNHIKYYVFFCLQFKFSIASELIEFFLSGKLHICPGMVLDYFGFRIKPWNGCRLFFCLSLPLQVQRPQIIGAQPQVYVYFTILLICQKSRTIKIL